MAAITRFEEFLTIGQAARSEWLEDPFGVTASPYTYTDDRTSKERYGLFRPYNTSNISTLILDVTQQTILNPLFTCLSNVLLVLAATISGFTNLCQAILTLNYHGADENSPLARVGIELLGIGYFLSHAVVDPLWESLAAMTRAVGTIGAVTGITEMVENAVNSYC